MFFCKQKLSEKKVAEMENIRKKDSKWNEIKKNILGRPLFPGSVGKLIQSVKKYFVWCFSASKNILKKSGWNGKYKGKGYKMKLNEKKYILGPKWRRQIFFSVSQLKNILFDVFLQAKTFSEKKVAETENTREKGRKWNEIKKKIFWVSPFFQGRSGNLRYKIIFFCQIRIFICMILCLSIKVLVTTWKQINKSHLGNLPPLPQNVGR